MLVQCDGNQPCDSCARSRVECNYLLHGDGRSDLKRKAAALKRDSDCLDRLFHEIKDSTDEGIPTLLDAVRTTSSIDEIESVLSQSPPSKPIKHQKANDGEDGAPKHQNRCPPGLRAIAIKPIQHNNITDINGGTLYPQCTSSAENRTLSNTNLINSSFEKTDMQSTNHRSHSPYATAQDHPQVSYLVGESKGWHQALRCNVEVLREQPSVAYHLQAASSMLQSSVCR